MAYSATNPNGQAAGANSAPVVIASDQSTIKTKLANDIPATVGSITSATSTVTAANLSGVGSVTVVISGTYAGVNLTNEVSYDGTNWMAIAAQVVGTANPVIQTSTGVITSNATVIFNVSPLLGIPQFRVRATAYTSGTANVVISPSAQFTQYAVNVATMPTTTVSGTVTSTMTGSSNVIGMNPTTSAIGFITSGAQSIQALSNTLTVVRAVQTRMYEYDIYNPNTAGVWVQLFNAATAGAVTLGTTAPIRTIYIPPTSGRDWTSPYSLSLSNGLVVACTTTNIGSAAPASPIQVFFGLL